MVFGSPFLWSQTFWLSNHTPAATGRDLLPSSKVQNSCLQRFLGWLSDTLGQSLAWVESLLCVYNKNQLGIVVWCKHSYRWKTVTEIVGVPLVSNWAFDIQGSDCQKATCCFAHSDKDQTCHRSMSEMSEMLLLSATTCWVCDVAVSGASLQSCSQIFTSLSCSRFGALPLETGEQHRTNAMTVYWKHMT